MKHEKTNFHLLFREQNYDEDLDNVTMVPNFIYSGDTFSVLFSSFPCLSKSFRKYFLFKVTLADIKRTI